MRTRGAEYVYWLIPRLADELHGANSQIHYRVDEARHARLLKLSTCCPILVKLERGEKYIEILLGRTYAFGPLLGGQARQWRSESTDPECVNF